MTTPPEELPQPPGQFKFTNKLPPRSILFEPNPVYPDPKSDEERGIMKQEQGGVLEPHQNKLLQQLVNVPPNTPVYYADESSFTESESDTESAKKKRYIEDTEEEIEIATKKQKLRHGDEPDNFAVRWWKQFLAWFKELFDKKKN